MNLWSVAHFLLSTNYTTALQLRLQSCDVIRWAIGSIQKYAQAQKRKSRISALFLVFVIDKFIDFHFSQYSQYPLKMHYIIINYS